MGDKLGYYRRWPTAGPITPAELAERTGTSEPYAREWLNTQAAGGYVELRRRGPAATRCPPSTPSRSPTRPARPTCPASSRSRSAPSGTLPTSSAAARDGDGLGWHEHNTDVHDGCERFFRTDVQRRTCVAEWMPALDGVVGQARGRRHGRRRRLRPRRVDDPDGPGVPELHVRRLGLPRRSRSRSPASAPPTAGVADRVTFEVAPAHRVHAAPATTWSRCSTACTTWATRSAPPGTCASAIADDGTWMVVEPMAGDHVEDNLNPVGRAYYGFSTLLCTPASLCQDVGLALGTQAGPAKIRDVSTPPGSRAFRTAATDAVQQRVRGAAVTTDVLGGHCSGERCTRAGPRTPTRRASSCATGSSSPTRLRTRASPRCVLVPTWSIVPSRFWKAQVGFLARHYRVITFDGRGSGRSGRPEGAAAYTDGEYADDIVAVLDATGDRAGRAGQPSRAGRPGRCTSPPGTPTRVRGHVRDRARRAASTSRPRAGTTSRGTSRCDEHRGLGEVQQALLARRRLRRLRRVLLRADVLRAALDQADRGLRRLGARDHARRRWPTPPPAGSGCDGACASRSRRCARAVTLPGRRGARHRRPHPAARVRRAAGRADRRRAGAARATPGTARRRATR